MQTFFVVSFIKFNRKRPYVLILIAALKYTKSVDGFIKKIKFAAYL